MGEFDKNPQVSRPADQKRKHILVAVLGLVFLAVICFHFLKGNPVPASAGMISPANAPAAAAITDTPDGALAKLDIDPTANLLQGNPALDPDLAAVPHDPFRVSEHFRAQVKVDLPPIQKQPDPRLVAVTPKVEAPVIPANALKLEGIMRMGGAGGNKLAAIVNGSILMTGQTVGNARIVEIHEDGIIVRHKDWPDGPSTTLTIQPKLK
jgi:hypothetical protein